MFAYSPLVLNGPERRHLHRKIVELASEFGFLSRMVGEFALTATAIKAPASHAGDLFTRPPATV